MHVYECNICKHKCTKNTKARRLNIIHETSAILFLLLIFGTEFSSLFATFSESEKLWCHDPKSPRYARPLGALPSADHLP